MFKKLWIAVFGLSVAIFSFGYSAENLQICKNKQYTVDQLYKDIKKAPVSSEDLGRYVWYGGRNVIFPVPLLWSCWSFYYDWKMFCDEIYSKFMSNKENFNLVQELQNLYNKLDDQSKLKQILSKMDFSSFDNFIQKNANAYIEYQNYINSITFYMLEKNNSGYVYNIPYKFLVPFNVTFNWSIQNLSSYYTDIWFVWLLLWFLVVLAFIYSLFVGNRFLAALSMANIFGYIIWWFVWSSILWYWIWLVAWTMFSVAVFFYQLARNSKNQYFVLTLFSLLFLIFIVQYWLNFVRIASQGGIWPMIWYKQSNWRSDDFIYSNKTYNKLKEKGLISSDFKLLAWQQISFIYNIVTDPNKYKQLLEQGDFPEQIANQVEFIIKKRNEIKSLFVKYPYIWKDIFDLQFNHYNRFVPVANARKEGEWIFIWWTYMRYFIKNQKDIYYDHMLVKLWEWLSDGDLCKSYQRIRKDKKIKYIVIDPNIWTVVRFDNASNKTLFDRFFGNINLATWDLEEKGVLTHLYDMIDNWYAKLFYTNNIAMKYAFIATDKDIKSYILAKGYSWDIDQNDILRFRYALLALRYPWSANLVSKFTKTNLYKSNAIYLTEFVYSQLFKRMSTLDFVDDIIDIKGDNISSDQIKKVIMLLQKALQVDKNLLSQVDKMIENLSIKERKVLYFILSIILSEKDIQEKVLTSLVDNSIYWQSQLFIVEFKD